MIRPAHDSEAPQKSPPTSGVHSVVVFCPLFPPAYLGGGPIRTLEALVQSTPPHFRASVITGFRDLGQREPLKVVRDEWVELGPRSRVRYINWRSIQSVLTSISQVRRSPPDAVYLNGFFSGPFTVAPQVLMRLRFLPRAQVVLAPRGEFGRAAIAIKSPKKRLFISVYRKLGLSKDIVWHASSTGEASDIGRVMGSEARIVIRENDVGLPPTAKRVGTRVAGPMRAIHVARLSPIKGLDVLLAGLRDVTVDLVLDIFGPMEDEEYVARCHELVKLLPANVTVSFCGQLEHQHILEVVAGYDVMLFPTHGENFGHVVAEALSASCPVFVADTTPWTPVIEGGGGTVVRDNTPEAWGETVQAYALLGRAGWSKGRQQAGEAYEAWRRRASEQPHLFTLIA